MKRILGHLLTGLLMAAAVAESPWEKEVAAYEATEQAHPAATGGVVFNGSSVIRLWDLNNSFPAQNYVNHGIGGSVISEATELIDRLILPLKPRIIVFYSGDNDLARGHEPDEVASDWVAYVTAVRAKLPQVGIILLGIKPSPARWALWPKAQVVNARNKAYCESITGVKYIDTAPVMLGEDGQPIRSLYTEDMLHLLPAGYERWMKLLAPEIAAFKP